MTRPRTMQRSYSTSHAHAPSYSVTHTVPSLGQGATVVRTPADATMCMAQPGAVSGNPWPYRQHSLREPPRRPSATPSPTLTEEFSTRVSSHSPPTLPELERSSTSAEILDEINEVHNRHTRFSKKKGSSSSLSFSFSNPFSSSSSATSTRACPTPSPQNEVSTPFFDVDAEYQRRLASRTSNLTITPKRNMPPSPGSRASPLPTPVAGTAADPPKPIGRSWNDHQAPTVSTASIASSSTATNSTVTGNGNGVYNGHSHNQSIHKVKSSISLARDESYRAHLARNSPPQTMHRPLPSISGGVPTPSRVMASPPSPQRGLSRSATMPSKHAPSASVATIVNPAAATQPFMPILTAHTTRLAPSPSMVLVTLRFSYSLDPDPNTHEVTVTLDTLRPAGGRLIAFLDHTLRPHSVQSSSTTTSEGGCTPPLSTEGPEMTDGSSAEDSDFEYDDTRLHPMLQEEYLVALAANSSPVPSPKDTTYRSGSGTPVRELSRQPSFRGGPPPSAYPGLGFGTPLPPLSALPAALAQARAEREAAAAASASHSATAPLSIRRPRSNTCPGPAKGTITELTVLLQRDAGAWHTIASRLCSGSWPELAGRRRRVEDECRWAGMTALLTELQQMPTLSRRGGFV